MYNTTQYSIYEVCLKFKQKSLHFWKKMEKERNRGSKHNEHKKRTNKMKSVRYLHTISFAQVEQNTTKNGSIVCLKQHIMSRSYVS